MLLRIAPDRAKLMIGVLPSLSKSAKEGGSFDVVISNGVINLAVDKPQVSRETACLPRRGGRLAIADIVTAVGLPQTIACNSTQWAACIGDAWQVERRSRPSTTPTACRGRAGQRAVPFPLRQCGRSHQGIWCEERLAACRQGLRLEDASSLIAGRFFVLPAIALGRNDIQAPQCDRQGHADQRGSQMGFPGYPELRRQHAPHQ